MDPKGAGFFRNCLRCAEQPAVLFPGFGGELLDAAAGVILRRRFVKADVGISTESQHREIQAACFCDFFIAVLQALPGQPEAVLFLQVGHRQQLILRHPAERLSLRRIEKLRRLKELRLRQAEFSLAHKFSELFPERKHRSPRSHGDHGIRLLFQHIADALRGTFDDQCAVRYKCFHPSVTSFPSGAC